MYGGIGGYMDETTRWLLEQFVQWAMMIPKYDGIEAGYLVSTIIATGLYFMDKYASVKTGECKVVKRIPSPMNNTQWWVGQVIQGR